MGVVKQKCSNCGAELDLYAENIILYCPCCAHELRSRKKEEPENISEIIEAGIHSAQTERWMGEIRERYGLTDDANNDNSLSGKNIRNKEITCPNCHTKLILTTSKDLRYCPCCAKEFPVEEKSVPNSFDLNEIEEPVAADGRKPVAVYSVKKRKKKVQEDKTYTDKILERIEPYLMVVLMVACPILLFDFYSGNDEFASGVFIIMFCGVLLGQIAHWIRKFIIHLHDRSVDKSS